MSRAGKRGVTRRRVAVLHLRRDVSGRRRPNQRRALGGRLGQFGDDGQVFILDDDGFQCILRLFGRFGDQRDHRLPHETDNAVRERWPQRCGSRRAVRALEHRRHRQRLYPGGDQIGPGQNPHDARHRGSRSGVDRDDPSVRVRGAQER